MAAKASPTDRPDRPAQVAALRLVALAGIGALAAVQWGSLLDDPPTFRLLGVVAIAVAVGWASSRLPARRSQSRALELGALLVAGAFASLLALGVPARELVPWGWDELAGNLSAGLDGLGGEFDFPLSGAIEWSRLLLVIAMVPLLLGAAVLGFRPGRSAGDPSAAALLTLIAAFAIPATARPTAAPILWGVALLPWVALWIWGARARRLPAVALVAGVAAIAIPVTTAAAGDEPPIDYRDWTLPTASSGIDFDWSHSYGPIDWPRTGTPLFRVRSDQPRYWRAEVLDEFYASGWRRSGGGGEPVPGEPVGYSPGVVRDADWTERADFKVLALESPLLISPGSALQVSGLDGTDRDPDGTMHTDVEPLSSGVSYSVTAYAPDPGARRMRVESRRYSRQLSEYTALALPDGADLESQVAPTWIDVPPWGSRKARDDAAGLFDDSAYRRVARLAGRLANAQPNAYDAVVAIQDFLRTRYRYDEQPPERHLPLRAFLFEDRIGYCQQFSGAMALMLRTVGIPSRIAAGFSPGERVSAGANQFEVTDLDAHSWVEVYFNGIGWVPFDPTPAAAPAQSQAAGVGVESAALGAGAFPKKSPKSDAGGDVAGSGKEAVGAPAEPAGGGGSPLPLALLLATAAAVVAMFVRTVRHRMLPATVVAERELAELPVALRTAGKQRSGSNTLLKIENQLGAGGLRAGGAYVRRLRELRYSRAGGAPPTLRQRRAARRELAAGGGVLLSLRMLLAMPPGGPRAPRGSRRV
jgi:Transglutaminase-like superfamily/TgpA N-terminal domain